MFNIIIHDSNQDQGVMDAICNKLSKGEKVVGTAATIREGLEFLKEHYPNAFLRNEWVIRRQS